MTLSPQTETKLQELAGLYSEEAQVFGDALLLEALEARRQEYEESCRATIESFADIEAGRTVSFEEAWAGREARRAARANLSKRTGIL